MCDLKIADLIFMLNTFINRFHNEGDFCAEVLMKILDKNDVSYKVIIFNLKI